MRIGIFLIFAASTTAFTRSSSPIFPGLIRSASIPCSIALKLDDNQNEYLQLKVH